VVADAHPEVRRGAPFITRAPGGFGAVREVIDAIVRAQGKMRQVLAMFEGTAS
jgi:3-deoxy-D-manno-octulosonate 8-phosphate phosphatase (KDO 8-P phosphatase)